jgi:hypothetical protein
MPTMINRATTFWSSSQISTTFLLTLPVTVSSSANIFFSSPDVKSYSVLSGTSSSANLAVSTITGLVVAPVTVSLLINSAPTFTSPPGTAFYVAFDTAGVIPLGIIKDPENNAPY